MRKSFWSAILSLSLLAATNDASAAFIDFIERALEDPPVPEVILVLTNLVLTAPVVVTPETATVGGFHHPGISPFPIAPGSRSAGLFEPGSTTLLSDYVLLTAGAIRPDPVFGVAQDITIDFFSVDTLVNNLPPAFPFGGGVVEDGTLQDISGFLGTLPEGLIVRVLSQPADVPEPSTLLLLGSGLAGLAFWRRKRQG